MHAYMRRYYVSACACMYMYYIDLYMHLYEQVRHQMCIHAVCTRVYISGICKHVYAYAHMHIHMHIHDGPKHVSVSRTLCFSFPCICNIYIYIYTHTHTYTCTHTHIYIYVYLFYTCTETCVRTSSFIHLFMSLFMHLCKNKLIKTKIQTPSLRLGSTGDRGAAGVGLAF